MDTCSKRKKIKVSCIGARPVMEYPPAGQQAVDLMIKHWEKQLESVLPNAPDIIVLPEACDRYPAHTISERKTYYERRGNQIRDFFRSVAENNSCYIAYSAARKTDDGTFRNSTQLIDRQGKVCGIYNKNHLVPDETYKGNILCGKDAPIFETDFGRVAMAICFDLNFHELLEKYAKARPDLIIFSSMYHGGLMQNYWAYHCRSYFAGAVAGDECTIINPAGEKIAHSTNYFEHITKEINLDCAVVHLNENWAKLESIKRKYGNGVSIFDPGNSGAVLLNSEMPEKSINEILLEYNIETWNEYYARCLRHRKFPENIEA